jgi:hypothetical protein
VGANLRMLATKKTLFESKAPDNKVRAFGLRAIHGRYDSTREFFSFEHNEEGSAIPTGVNRRVRTSIGNWIWDSSFSNHLLICMMTMEMT